MTLHELRALPTGTRLVYRGSDPAVLDSVTPLGLIWCFWPAQQNVLLATVRPDWLQLADNAPLVTGEASLADDFLESFP